MFSYIGEELAGMMDDNDNDNIPFSKVMEFYLPRFDNDVVDNGVTGHPGPALNLWEWQAAQMGNCMMYLIDHHGFKPNIILQEILWVLFIFYLTMFVVS